MSHVKTLAQNRVNVRIDGRLVLVPFDTSMTIGQVVRRAAERCGLMRDSHAPYFAMHEFWLATRTGSTTSLNFDTGVSKMTVTAGITVERRS